MTTRKQPPVYLSRAEHEEVYAQIRQHYLESAPPQPNPRAIFLAGQPGAGKSKLEALEGDRLGGNSSYVLVNIDHLRDWHPDYHRLMQADDRSAADRVQPDVAAWGDRLIRDAGDKHRHILVDGTLKTPANAKANFEYLRGRGYRLEVHALAVREADSRLGTYFRYEAERRETGVGRWNAPAEQKVAASGLIDTLQQIERDGLADRIQVSARNGRRGELQGVYDSDQRRGNGPPDAATAVLAERDRVLSGREKWERAEAHADLMSTILDRDPGLDEPENRLAARDAARAFADAPGFPVPAHIKRERSLGDRIRSTKGRPDKSPGSTRDARDER